MSQGGLILAAGRVRSKKKKQNKTESRRTQTTLASNAFFMYGNSLYEPASWMHTKGDMSDVPSVKPTEQQRTPSPGSRGSETHASASLLRTSAGMLCLVKEW